MLLSLLRTTISRAAIARAIAGELDVDRLVFIGNMHTLFDKTGHIPFVGRLIGKNLGQAHADVTVLDENGNRLVWITASDVSNQGALRIGIQNPSKVMPMFREVMAGLGFKPIGMPQHTSPKRSPCFWQAD